jgi:adenine phosphoribosyltransferase
MKAAIKLTKRFNPKAVYVNFIIELKELNGRAIFSEEDNIEAVLVL